MEKKRTFKSILFILFLIVVTIIVFVAYYHFTGKENPLSEIFNTSTPKSSTDSINGFYVYNEALGKQYNIYSGCNVSTLDYEILVMGEQYRMYKTSCMGSYFIDDGDTEDLDIQYDQENDVYYIEYDNHVYHKRHEVTSVVLGNTFLKNADSINMNSYKFILDQTEFKGNYYNINGLSMDGASKFKLYLNVSEEGYYKIGIDSNNSQRYSRYETPEYSDVESMPDVYTYGKIIVFVYPDVYNGAYRYKFEIIDVSLNVVYDLATQFPIVVNDHTLSTQDYIYIAYQSSDRSFKMLVSESPDFCEEDSDSTDIAYYLFSLKYNYLKVNFDAPQFERLGYKNEGCKYVNNLMGG